MSVNTKASPLPRRPRGVLQERPSLGNIDASDNPRPLEGKRSSFRQSVAVQNNHGLAPSAITRPNNGHSKSLASQRNSSSTMAAPSRPSTLLNRPIIPKEQALKVLQQPEQQLWQQRVAQRCARPSPLKERPTSTKEMAKALPQQNHQKWQHPSTEKSPTMSPPPRPSTLSERPDFAKKQDENVLPWQSSPIKSVGPNRSGFVKEQAAQILLQQQGKLHLAQKPLTASPPPRRLQSKRITSKLFRRVFLSLRNERKQAERTKLELRDIYTRIAKHDQEIQRIQNSGSVLRELYLKQGENLHALQSVFTVEEAKKLREVSKRQQQELAWTKAVIPSLEEQVTLLTEQIRSLNSDIAQLKSEKREQEKSYKDQNAESFRSSEARSSNCSDTITAEEDYSEISQESCTLSSLHRKTLAMGPRHSSDKKLTEMQKELNQVVDPEQIDEQAHNDALKELKTSSTRFGSLESLKLMLKCTSPRLNNCRSNSPCLNFTNGEKKNEISKKMDKYGIYSWNLKPT